MVVLVPLHLLFCYSVSFWNGMGYVTHWIKQRGPGSALNLNFLAISPFFPSILLTIYDPSVLLISPLFPT